MWPQRKSKHSEKLNTAWGRWSKARNTSNWRGTAASISRRTPEGEGGYFLRRWRLQVALPRRRWMAPRPLPTAVDSATTHCPAFLRSVLPRGEHTSYSVTGLILGACARRLDAKHRLTLPHGAGLPPGAPETGRSSFLQEGGGSCHRHRTPESRFLVLRQGKADLWPFGGADDCSDLVGRLSVASGFKGCSREPELEVRGRCICPLSGDQRPRSRY